MDPLNEPQQIPAVKDELKVPTESEHRRLIIRIFISCISAALTVFVVFGGIVLALFLKGIDDKRIINVSTAVFQVLSMSGAVGFFIPLGLASIVTLFIGIRMSRKSVAVLDKLDSAVESRLIRTDALFQKIENFVGGLEKGELPSGIKGYIDDGKAFVKKELEALRADIRGAKADADAELGKALDEGELEAAATGQGTPATEYKCRSCGTFHSGAQARCP